MLDVSVNLSRLMGKAFAGNAGSLNIFSKDGLQAGFYFRNTLLNLPAFQKKAPYIAKTDMCAMNLPDIYFQLTNNQ